MLFCEPLPKDVSIIVVFYDVAGDDYLPQEVYTFSCCWFLVYLSDESCSIVRDPCPYLLEKSLGIVVRVLDAHDYVSECSGYVLLGAMGI